MSEPSSEPGSGGLSHLDARGRAHMVDVGHKPATARRAVAEATVRLPREVRELLLTDRLPKGEALAAARVAGILAAKDTARLIPLCHPLPLAQVAIAFEPVGDDRLRVEATAATVASTGVEMEAMVAASIAALTIYDMVKGASREACVEHVRLLHKSGGRSGTWQANGTGPATGEGAP